MNFGMPDNWWYWNCLIKDLLNEGHIWPLIFVMLCWGIFQDIFTFCILCFMEKNIMWTYLILGILRKEYYFKLFYDFKYRSRPKIIQQVWFQRRQMEIKLVKMPRTSAKHQHYLRSWSFVWFSLGAIPQVHAISLSWTPCFYLQMKLM